jgi:hypothetical protein
MRKTHAEEMKADLTGAGSRDPGARGAETPQSPSEKVLALIGRVGAHVLAGDGGRLQKPGPDHPTGRFGPDDPTGAACNCATIKNYPPFTGIKVEVNGHIERGLAVSDDFMAGHEITKDDDPDGS